MNKFAKELNFGYVKTNYVSEIPNKKELERMTIPQLLVICLHKTRISAPFKPILINYLMSLKSL